MIDELEEWAHVTTSRPERHRMYFCAHCLKSPNFFKRYNVDFIYEVTSFFTTSLVLTRRNLYQNPSTYLFFFHRSRFCVLLRKLPLTVWV